VTAGVTDPLNLNWVMPAEGAVRGPTHVLVVAGGDRAVTAGATTLLPSDGLVVAADSGVDFAYEMGWRVDVAIGDFDSISAEGLARATAEGVRIERHPTAKDHTDLELALDEAIRLGASDMVVLGIGGGRLDHLLANLLVLASPGSRRAASLRSMAPPAYTSHARRTQDGAHRRHR